eukprot:scaffold31266_cov18-Prasinocladus_malaysianus.AAC.1
MRHAVDDPTEAARGCSPVFAGRVDLRAMIAAGRVAVCLGERAAAVLMVVAAGEVIMVGRQVVAGGLWRRGQPQGHLRREVSPVGSATEHNAAVLGVRVALTASDHFRRRHQLATDLGALRWHHRNNLHRHIKQISPAIGGVIAFHERAEFRRQLLMHCLF